MSEGTDKDRNAKILGTFIKMSEKEPFLTYETKEQEDISNNELVGEQVIRSRSLFDIEVKLPDNAFTENQHYAIDISENEHWLVWIQNINKKGIKITIWIAEDITSIEHDLEQFMIFAVISIMLSIVVFLVTQFNILNRGFSQLDHVRESIRSKRLGIDDVSLQQLPVEILPLVEEIDRLLSQLGQRVQRTRNSIGNLAHELKRPLQHYQI